MSTTLIGDRNVLRKRRFKCCLSVCHSAAVCRCRAQVSGWKRTAGLCVGMSHLPDSGRHKLTAGWLCTSVTGENKGNKWSLQLLVLCPLWRRTEPNAYFNGHQLLTDDVTYRWLLRSFTEPWRHCIGRTEEDFCCSELIGINILSQCAAGRTVTGKYLIT